MSWESPSSTRWILLGLQVHQVEDGATYDGEDGKEGAAPVEGAIFAPARP